MRRFLLLCLSLVCAASLSAQGKIRELLAAKAPEGFVEKTWTVDGVKRTALVRMPAGVSGPLAVVFGWHGHGGRSTHSAARWGYAQIDTASILVFPQGLPTVSPLVGSTDNAGVFSASCMRRMPRVEGVLRLF